MSQRQKKKCDSKTFHWGLHVIEILELVLYCKLTIWLFFFFLKSVLPRKSQGYIQVFLDGGLNQQRMGVGDLHSRLAFGNLQ